LIFSAIVGFVRSRRRVILFLLVVVLLLLVLLFVEQEIDLFIFIIITVGVLIARDTFIYIVRVRSVCVCVRVFLSIGNRSLVLYLITERTLHEYIKGVILQIFVRSAVFGLIRFVWIDLVVPLLLLLPQNSLPTKL